MDWPYVGQGRAGSKSKKPDPINPAINQASNLSQKIPGRTEIETRKTNHMHSTNNMNDKMAGTNPLIPDGAFHLGLVYRPPPKTIKQNMTHAQSSQSLNINNNNSDINFDLPKFPISRGYCVQNISETRQIIFSGTKRIRRSYK